RLDHRPTFLKHERIGSVRAPLLVEVSNTEIEALVADVSSPLRVHDSRTGPAFATGDDPVRLYPIIWQSQRPNGRLVRDESDASGDFAQLPPTLIERGLMLGRDPE